MAEMWEHQAGFRWSLEQLADEVLDRAGANVDPRAYLIGFRDSGEVTVEPPRGHFDREILADALERCEQRFRRSKARREAGDDPAALAAAESLVRREVLAERLDEASRAGERVHFAGIGVQIGAWFVVPVLAIHAEHWNDLARLRRTPAGDASPRSFPEACVTATLDAASRELDRQLPGLRVVVDPDAVLRQAADNFVATLAQRTGQEAAWGVRHALDAVSAQPYEGRAGTGTVLLAAQDHPDVHVDVALEHPVPIGLTRSFRKILEMSTAGLSVLCDGREVHGLGSVTEDYNADSEYVFTVTISGSGSWELWHGATPLLRMENGVPQLPRERLDEEEFGHTVDRVFPEASARNARHLWEMAVASAKQSHGTMLVVHPDAAAEADRLLPQVFAIEPTRLTGKVLTAATSIDGAVLVSPDGRVHAVGVILDGVATGTGDSGRGARYNSAIRYLAGAGRGAMVIIVSEDGKIDLLPKLMRRMRRETVERTVARLVARSAEGEDRETFDRANRAVEAIEFYLNQDQCDRVNDAREAVHGRQWAEDLLRRQFIPVAPDPAMDDSYFVDRRDVAQADVPAGGVQ
ncbi:MAG: DNA integrity scanning protein DisA nucleotide-binding domain protein [Propionibacteriaceae bacterium]|nr:DNA integrity scanning protein DisA nucleotide-binding domain protein [Propionibacteriaceae bacterium]